jgi:hypothetical protein
MDGEIKTTQKSKTGPEHSMVRVYVSMFVTLCGVYAVWNEWFYNYFAVVMTAYMTYGLFVDSWDYCVHHVLAISFIVFKIVFCPNDSRTDYTMIYLTRCEYTSIFYGGKIMVNDLIKRSSSTQLKKIAPILKNAFDLVFLASFIKIRIIDVGYHLISNQNVYSWHHDVLGNNTFAYFQYNLSVWTFYVLNIYWLMIILKKAYKTILEKYDSYLVCECISQYSVLISLGAVSYVYHQHKFFEIPALINANGLIILSYSSYKFHQFVYNKLQTTGESFDTLTKVSSKLMLNDAAAIGFHTFSTFVASVWGYYEKSTLFISGCVGFMAVFSSVCIWSTRRFIRNMKSNDEQLIFNQENPKRITIYLLINAPSIMGVVVNLFIEKEYRPYPELMVLMAKHISLVCTTLLVIGVVPFGKLNHVAIHIIFAICNYHVAKQIMRK